MFKLVSKWWKYLTAKLTGSFNERADPKVQLEQAIAEAQNQHRRLKEQAANVIANQKQSELRLNAKMTELEKLNATARQALIMAADAEKAGDATKSTQYTTAAETIANQLIQVEKDVESLKNMVLESTQASDQAKAAVQQNSRLLQEKIAEKSKLLSQLDQAKMQEEMNSAMAQLTETVGADVPTLSEVQDKIQARYAKAKAHAELSETSVESRVLEVEQATANVEAQSRLSELRAELGLGGASPAPAEVERGPDRGRRAARGPTDLTFCVTAHVPEDVCGDTEPSQPGSSTRSSRWMTSWTMPAGQVAGVAAGDAAQLSGLDEHHAAGEGDALGVGDVDRVPGTERARHLDDARRQQARLALDQRPPGPVVDDDGAGDVGGEGDPQLRAPSACGGGPRSSCRPVRRRSPRPAPRAGRRRRSPCGPRTTTRCAPPPACSPCRRCPARCRRRRRGSTAAGRRLPTCVTRAASAWARGSAVYSPSRSVSSTSTPARDVVGDEGGDAVVVAVARLVAGDGVVLVDDRHRTELEQAGQGVAGVQVLAAVDEVVRDEQRLGRHQPVGSERDVPAAHQAGLTGGRDRLQGGDVGRALVEPEGGDAGGDRAGRHEHDLVPGGAQPRRSHRRARRSPRRR